MNASKENVRKVRQFLKEFLFSMAGWSPQEQEELEFMREFLQVAEKKLPSEAAYRRAAKRPRRVRTP